MGSSLEILRIGFLDGLIWFPFVLGIGLLYKHLKIIDVSIDGTAIICGIACAWIWTLSRSYTLSIFGAIVFGVAGYSVVWILITKLRINAMLAGILFSLIIHALSVILIGESMVLSGTGLFPSFLSFSVIPLVTTIITGSGAEIYYRTNVGVSTRLVGSTPNANTTINPQLLTWLGFCVTGIVVGIGSAIYTHQQGVARAGGGFEFLVTGLSSFLLVDRFIELASAVAARGRGKHKHEGSSTAAYFLDNVLHSVAFKALVGSIFFQIIVLFIITNAPNPAYWKLIFGLALLISVAKPIFSKWRGTSLGSRDESQNGLTLKNLAVAYDLGYASRNIFESLTVEFMPGVNYVWGPNGSGKSTLLGCIRGDVAIQKGEILVDGTNVTNWAGHKRKIFLLTQNPYKSVSPDLRVYENLIAAGQHRRTILGFSSHQAILDELEAELAKVKLTQLSKDDSDIWLQESASLSGGQAQRVALYMALLSDADVLLADEPSSGLDSDNLSRLVAVFESFAAVGKTLIIATHDNRLARAPGQHFEIRSGKLLSFEDAKSIVSAGAKLRTMQEGVFQ